MKILWLLILSVGCVAPSKLAKVCAERFPIKEETKEIIRIDTVISKSDTIVVRFKDSVAVVICPPIQVITKTREVLKTVESTAKLEAFKQENTKANKLLVNNFTKENKELLRIIESKNKDIEKLQNKYDAAKKYRQRFWLLLSIIISYFAIRFGFKYLVSRL